MEKGTSPEFTRSEEACEPVDDKDPSEVKHLERTITPPGNLAYDIVDEEPEVHIRTYIATAAMFLLNLVQVFALQGPPVAVCYRLAVQAERVN